MLVITLRKPCYNLMQYTKVNDLTWMHTLFLGPLERKLVILLISQTQQYLLILSCRFHSNKLTLTHSVSLCSVNVAVTLFLPLSVHSSHIGKHICQPWWGFCIVSVSDDARILFCQDAMGALMFWFDFWNGGAERPFAVSAWGTQSSASPLA